MNYKKVKIGDIVAFYRTDDRKVTKIGVIDVVVDFDYNNVGIWCEGNRYHRHCDNIRLATIEESMLFKLEQ